MKRKGMITIMVLLLYAAMYCLCRQFFFIGREYHMYTPDWTAKNILWIAAAVSSVPALFGFYRFSFITLLGYILGVIVGEWFGETMKVVQEGLPAMPYHYGWWICMVTYATACFAGMVVEYAVKKKGG